MDTRPPAVGKAPFSIAQPARIVKADLLRGIDFSGYVWYNEARNKRKDTAMKHVYIYTDGACRGNPGPGGWGAILVYNGREKELSGGEPLTTNNRMELTAVITALSALKEPCEVTLTSDSKYVVDGITKGWARSWKAKGWIKGDKTPALNPDLWDALLTQLDRHKVEFVWVRGHAGHPYNERCDLLATTVADSFKA